MFDLLLQANVSTGTSSADVTDWIRAVAAALGIPLAIWGIFKLFRKDHAQERKISSLEQLAHSQAESNNHLRGQVHQLKMTTKTLEEHSHYYSGNLERLTEQSIEMTKQTRLLIASNDIVEQRLRLEISAQKENLEVQYDVTKEFFLTTIINLEKGLSKQVKNGREFAKTVALQRLTDFTLVFTLGANEMIASNFSLEKLFRIFVVQGRGEKEDKTRIFAKLVLSVEYLRIFKTVCQQELTMYAERIERHDRNWKRAIREVQANYEILIREVSRTPGKSILMDPFAKNMADVVLGWMQTEPVDRQISRSDPFYLIDVYVSPMKEVCRKYVGDPRIEVFLPDLVQCELAVKEMKHLKSSTSDFFLKISDDLEGVLNDFIDVYAFHSSNP